MHLLLSLYIFNLIFLDEIAVKIDMKNGANDKQHDSKIQGNYVVSHH